MRPIDADALKHYMALTDDGHGVCYVPSKDIRRAPTIDAVPVVRCKDCINYEAHSGWPGGYCYHWDYEPGSSPNEVEEDDFCSCGERRSE